MNKNYLFLALVITFTTFTTFSANRYWVATSAGTWNANSNWSTSSGGASGASAPGASDLAIFDGALVGGVPANGNCSMSSAVSALGIQISGYAGVISQGGNSISIGTSGFSQASGTFTGNASAITITGGAFTLSGGSFTSTSGNLTITGTYGSSQTSFNQTGGTFNHNSGTVVFSPSTTGCPGTLTFTMDVITSTYFYNLYLSCAPSCGTSYAIIATGANDTVDVQNDLTHDNGYISGQFQVERNLIVNANADGGTGTIFVDGSTAQTYAVPVSAPRTCKLYVTQTGAGTFSAASGTTVLSCQGFTLNSGTFTAPSGNFSVGGTWSSSQTLFTHVAGTFNHNNGTFVFDPSSTGCPGTLTWTIDVLTGTYFYNVYLSAAPSCGTSYAVIATAAGDTVDAQNNFTHDNGYISGNFQFEGNFILNANSDGGSGYLIADGTGAQTYSVASGSPRTCWLVINETGAGSLSAAGGTTALSVQGFSLLGGTFTAPTGNFSVGGTWSSSQTLFNHSAGTFNHNNGTLVFDPSSTGCPGTLTWTLDVLTGTYFYNVYLSAAPSCGTSYAVIATAAGDTVDAQNNFTHDNGYISGNFQFEGNFILNANSDGGSGYLIADGTGAQTYSVASGTPRTCWLVVNETGGSLSAAGGTTSLSVQGFSLVKGTFTAPSGNFSVGGTWTSSQTLFNHVAGTFNHNNGTLVFDPSSTGCPGTLTWTIDVLTGTYFYDVYLSAAPSCGTSYAIIATAANDTIDALHNFTHDNGYISGAFQFEGNLIVNTNADGGSGYLIADGTSAQTYSITSGTPRTCWLKVMETGAGSFSAASGTTFLSVQGFSLISGTFTAPSGNFSVGGTWSSSQTLFTHVAGTFNHNNGTFVFDPSSTGCPGTLTWTIDVLTGTYFYDVYLSASPSCGTSYAIIATASNDTVDALHNFTHDDGYISGAFQFEGNLIVNANSDGGSGYLIADGTGAQTYSVASSAPRTCWLKVIETGAGSLSPASGTTLLSVQGFSLVSGTFNAPTGNFSVGGTWSSNQTLFNHSGGTFNHNSGTFVFDPSSTGCPGTLTWTIDVLTSTYFYDVYLTAAPSCGTSYAIIATASNDTVDALHNLTHDNGYISGTFQFENNLIINGNSDGGSGYIIADGTVAQTYSVASGAPRTCWLKVIETGSGSLSAASGTTDFSVQGFTLQSGTFNAPTGSFSVGGTWASSQTLFNHVAGTFNHNNGTFVFDPTSTGCPGTLTWTIDVITSTVFYNATLNASPSCGTSYARISGGANDTLDVANILLYTNGQCNANIEVGGNVTVASTFDSGSGQLIFKGSSNQTFDLTGATSLFDGNVKLNKSLATATITLQSACQLDAASQTLTFVNGVLVADPISVSTNLLIIGSGVTVSGASNNSYVDGAVRKIGNTAFTFPVGKSGYYRSIAMSAPSNATHHFTAEYIIGDAFAAYPTTNWDAGIDHLSECEYWILNRTNGSSNVSVTLSWGTNSCGVNNLSDLVVARYDAGTNYWKNHGNGGTTGNTTAGTVVTSAAVTSFSPFTLSSRTTNNSLPIELLSFKAVMLSGNKVKLDWSTATETNNHYFTIEKSKDGVNFIPLKQVNSKAPNGNSLATLYYEDFDLVPYQGVTYYRLQQTDYNGAFTYSGIISVTTGDVKHQVSIYPNPTQSGNTSFLLKGMANKNVDVSIRNVLGQEVYRAGFVPDNNDFSFVLSGQSLLPAGTYFVNVRVDEEIYTLKWIIN